MTKHRQSAVSGQRSAFGVFALVFAIALGALALPTPLTRAQSGDPTLDAAQLAIWQATRRAQQTREAYEYAASATRSEQTRVAGDATRAYAQTRAALDTYATRQAIDAHATRAAIESEATATAERYRQDAFATRQSADATAIAAQVTQTAVHAATREAQTRVAIGATATIQAASADATRTAIARAADDETRFTITAQVFVLVILGCIIAVVAVAIRVLLQTPRPVIVESPTRAETRADAPADSQPSPAASNLPPTRVVFDPDAIQRITEILEFQDDNERTDHTL